MKIVRTIRHQLYFTCDSDEEPSEEEQEKFARAEAQAFFERSESGPFMQCEVIKEGGKVYSFDREEFATSS